MKKLIVFMAVAMVMVMMCPNVMAQPGTENYNTVNVQSLHTKWPDNGTLKARDSLVEIYNKNVVNNNEYILSHREYSHWFTSNNHDYLVIEEYKDLATMEKAFARSTELEKKAWPDEKKRKEFFDMLGAYFENWHGDALYRINPKLSKP